MASYHIDNFFFNEDVQPKFETIDDLRAAMTLLNKYGDAYLDYILEGNYFHGKGIWINQNPETKEIYSKLVTVNPHLQSESPYGYFFNQNRVRVRGENEIILDNIKNAPSSYQAIVNEYYEKTSRRLQNKIAIFSGGPAAKIASILAKMNNANSSLSVRFLIDGAEQSNESASASYEHVNHANALNAEYDNTGLGILFSALRRMFFGEKNPAIALNPSYHKVDLWPHGIRLRDIPIYIHNEIHGVTQKLKALFGIQNDHYKSRMASKISTHVLSYIEKITGISLRLPYNIPRAFFLYYTKKQYRHSLRDHKKLAKIGIYPKRLTGDQVLDFYGKDALKHIVAGDIFYENFCISHGFDKICLKIISELGGTYTERIRIKKIYFDKLTEESEKGIRAVGILTENIITKEEQFMPLSYLGLSLGPTATYKFADAKTSLHKFFDKLLIRQPVPYQTIATGFSGQLLFKIIDRNKFKVLPYTGLKQTHFVEIGQYGDYVVIKLTSGGVIGLPVYSRSYPISAISNMLRVLTPESGLMFIDVVCAWPGTRAINGTNNGQVVRLAENLSARFGEGGTGMSKMGTNAQTILDLIGLKHDLPDQINLPYELYKHTIIDNRRLVSKRLFS